MNKPIIYLAGNMTPDPKIYADWVGRFTEMVSEKYRTTSSNFKEGNKFIVRQDLGRLTNAHILVVNLGVKDVTHHLTGLVVECYEAYKQNMPVYAFVGYGLERSQQADAPWLTEFITKEFPSEGALQSYLLNNENLIV